MPRHLFVVMMWYIAFWLAVNWITGHAHLPLYHTFPTFNDPEKEGFWKHCGEKEKMLVTSAFSFSRNVSYPSQREFLHLSYIYFVGCKCFQFGPVKKICHLVHSKLKLLSIRALKRPNNELCVQDVKGFLATIYTFHISCFCTITGALSKVYTTCSI